MRAGRPTKRPEAVCRIVPRCPLPIESADLRSKHKRARCVRDRPVNLSRLSVAFHVGPTCLRRWMKPIQYGNPRATATCHSRSSHCSCRFRQRSKSARIATDLSPDDVLTALLVDTRGFPNASVRDRFVCEFFRNSCALLCFLSLSFFPPKSNV